MASRLRSMSEQFVRCPMQYSEFYSFIPKEEHEIIKIVEAWAQKYLTTSEFNQCYDKAEFPVHLLKPLQELDIIKYFIGKHGGQVISTIGQGMILATLASYDASVATFVMLQGPLIGKTLERLGSEEQKQKYIPDIIKLRKIWGWALTQEKVGSNASNIQTNVKKTSTGYTLNGNKRWIGNGQGDYLVVYAKNLDKGKVQAFVVDTKTPGVKRFKIENKLGMRCVQNYQIYFDNVKLGADAFIPDAKSFRKGVESMLRQSRVQVIFIAFGVCLGAYREAAKYASERIQFKVPISAFQLTQYKLVKMMANLQAVGLMCFQAAHLHSIGETTPGMVGMIKAFVTERGRQICRWGRQILGGNGIIHDRYLMKAVTDMEAIYTYEGTYDINTLIAGRQLTGMSAFK